MDKGRTFVTLNIVVLCIWVAAIAGTQFVNPGLWKIGVLFFIVWIMLPLFWSYRKREEATRPFASTEEPQTPSIEEAQTIPATIPPQNSFSGRRVAGIFIVLLTMIGAPGVVMRELHPDPLPAKSVYTIQELNAHAP